MNDPAPMVKPRTRRQTIAAKKPSAPENVVPADWRMQIAHLLSQPGLPPDDARTLLRFMAWRKLPKSYFGHVALIAHRIGLTG